MKLYAFTCGWMTLRTSTFLVGAEGKVRVPVPAYLIDHPEGRALFDTGLGERFRRDLKVDAPRNVDFDGTADIATRLRAIDIDPASIRWIINSHLHTDHCGGNLWIPNATVIVQQSEWDYAFNEGGVYYDLPEYDTGHKVLKIQGEYDLYGDGSVVLFPTPGHTPGHQAARVRLPDGDVVLAADCCNMKVSLEQMWLPADVHDVEESLATLRRLSDLRDAGSRIFYGHDADFWTGVPQAEPLK
ncbi:MAG: N-acyl homoserine lactonase family protein [Phenylobacterium sp.]